MLLTTKQLLIFPLFTTLENVVFSHLEHTVAKMHTIVLSTSYKRKPILFQFASKAMKKASLTDVKSSLNLVAFYAFLTVIFIKSILI